MYISLIHRANLHHTASSNTLRRQKLKTRALRILAACFESICFFPASLKMLPWAADPMALSVSQAQVTAARHEFMLSDASAQRIPYLLLISNYNVYMHIQDSLAISRDLKYFFQQLTFTFFFFIIYSEGKTKEAQIFYQSFLAFQNNGRKDMSSPQNLTIPELSETRFCISHLAAGSRM